MFYNPDIKKLEKIKNLKISTSTIIDILDGLTSGSVLSHELHPLNMNDFYIVGHAYTVQWKLIKKGKCIIEKQSSTWEQVQQFLVPELHNASGLIYVAGYGDLMKHAALAGGMSCTYFQQLGFNGIILGGAVRDIQELRDLNIPVIASNIIPSDTQGAYYVSETGTSCRIEDNIIQTGDLIISDANGSVVVPLDMIDKVFEEAVKINNTENTMLAQIKSGRRLPDLINETGRI
ncbi:RraA family protein [Providencia rettgeri]|uniref:Putative 4-hydroxy-4-methyl-2-oxoglutarate aldolase n=1 Tax=Providencia rettgeri TaxID=587 RepID=A0A264VMI1_PRORE|nr:MULTISPECIES: RraA family protein [Providencia]OZS72550.1 dimethylmenaquinone methyltransferase [Providencia rettgeri]SPZ22466.1 4-carboxy-4-hydroxy-2-oxoadipate aldolase/oxaloacetate decarboxylase [Providencia rettgeri]